MFLFLLSPKFLFIQLVLHDYHFKFVFFGMGSGNKKKGKRFSHYFLFNQVELGISKFGHRIQKWSIVPTFQEL